MTPPHIRNLTRYGIVSLLFLFCLDCDGDAGPPSVDSTDEAMLRSARHRVSVGHLTTEHLIDPLGINASAPRLSWIIEAGHNGASQTAYELRVSSRDSPDGDVWSSGRVASIQSFDVEYAGPPLRPRSRYYWAVRVWVSGADSPSPWSGRASFETAFLDASEFGGQWIGRATTALPTQTPEVLLRKEFSLPGKRIASARAYVAGLGYHKLHVNGRRVGDHELDPAYTMFDQRVLYVTHDVTHLLRRGEVNAIGVSLGHGSYPDYPVLKLELDVIFTDGSSARIVSDGSWKTDDGPTVANSVRLGETYDARLEQPGWNAPGFDAIGWAEAIVRTGPAGRLEAQDLEPIRVTGELPAPVVTQPAAGVSIFDFRTTRAGWATVRLRGPVGATVTMAYGEKLLADGTVNHNNTLQSYTYILRGQGVETFTPSYSYDGYRYLQINAPEEVALLSVRGKTVATDVASTGDFTSSDDLLNRYHQAMRASITSNLHSIPTDTPMYEKNGWTGDGHLFVDSALLNFGSENLWEKWMIDHRDSQGASGQLPVVLPSLRAPSDEPVWTASFVLINWALYQRRGNLRTLEANYDAMKRWMEYYESFIEPTGDIYTGFTYGDHEPAGGGPDAPAPADFPRPQDNRAIGTAFIYQSAVTLAEIARVLGRTADAGELDAFAGRVREAYNVELYDAEARRYSASPPEYRQTDNLVPLVFGLVPEADRQVVCENLIDDVHVTWNDHLSTGAIGTKFILPVLTECGDLALAYRVATNATYPGWGWWFQTVHGSVHNGETYIVDSHWEAWCWFGSGGDCLGDPARSHNHAFRGTVDDWLYEYVAGIRPTAPAYRRIRIKPHPVGELTDASAHITSPLGKVSSAWTRTGRSFTLRVHVPVGAMAEVFVPVTGGATASQEGGARPVESGGGDGYALFEVGSGDYTFRAPH